MTHTHVPYRCRRSAHVLAAGALALLLLPPSSGAAEPIDASTEHPAPWGFNASLGAGAAGGDVGRQTFARTVKPSARVLGRIARANRLDASANVAGRIAGG